MFGSSTVRKFKLTRDSLYRLCLAQSRVLVHAKGALESSQAEVVEQTNNEIAKTNETGFLV